MGRVQTTWRKPVRVIAAIALLSACTSPPSSDPPTRASTQPIIDGTPAADMTGIVFISHPNLPIVCSGTLIAPTLVVTAKHCVIRETTDDDLPLSPDGFTIGFGPSTDELVPRHAAFSTWIGAPDNPEIQPAVDAGEDVAVLVLTEPAPPGTHVHSIDLDHTPTAGDTYTLVGFGRSSLTDALAGERLLTVDRATAFGPDTGIIEATGNGACDGDSGGPYLFGVQRSSVSGSDQVRLVRRDESMR